MSADVAHELQRKERTTGRARARPARARFVLALGPATMLAGLGWALVQPWRLTLLHPYGQGFWWLVAEPPLYVVLAGLVFWRVVGRPLAEDLDREAAEP